MPLERPESPPGRASRHAGPAPEGQDRAVAASQAILPAEGVGGTRSSLPGSPMRTKPSPLHGRFFALPSRRL